LFKGRKDTKPQQAFITCYTNSYRCLFTCLLPELLLI